MKRTCSVESCDKATIALGLCAMHRRRLRREGDVFADRPPRAYGSIEERFWSKVERTDACWIWMAAHSSEGYGSFRDAAGRTIGAHRMSWILSYGPIPPGHVVMHRCDNPPCVRPNHLMLGTDAENHADRARKGRGRSDDRKLTAEDVIIIRTRYAAGEASQRSLAIEFGVAQMLINRIVRHQIWRHVA